MASSNTYGNSVYVIVQGPSWAQAEANAVKLGGHLATINDSGESEFVRNFFTSKSNQLHLWIGLNDYQLDQNFRWISGESLSFTNWSPGEPGGVGVQTGVHMYRNGFWNDHGDDNLTSFGIAEIPSPPPTINLGTYTDSGESFKINLISPFTTSDGSTYYLLDANGDGSSENIAGQVVDAVLRETLDTFFNKGSDTSINQRTVNLGAYQLSLPTIAELSQIRSESGGLPPTGWIYIANNGSEQVSTYHTADRYAADGHSIFGLTNGVTYSRAGLETDSVSRQFVA
jgi:hypothetical protein